MSDFTDSLKTALETLKALSTQELLLDRVIDVVEKALLDGKKLMFCGNGGSASEAAHIATEFTGRFKEDRRPYPAMALGVDGGFLTAMVNDYHAEKDIFARQVRAFAKPGDVLIALSTSGCSKNVFHALEEAAHQQMRTVAFLGKGGGFTKGIAEIELIIASQDTARIQEAHLFLLHVLCERLDERLPRE